MKKPYSRRDFVKRNSIAGLGTYFAVGLTPSVFADNVRAAETPAIPGGQKIRTTRGAYHLFPFRYKKEEFKGMSRADFIRALSAEGIPCGSGYSAGLNTKPFINDAFKSKNYQRMYSAEELNWDKFVANNQCPVNDRVCNGETVAFGQRMLLAERSDMDDIIRAIEKIYNNAGKIRKD